jgi:molecular chaperone GrpE
MEDRDDRPTENPEQTPDHPEGFGEPHSEGASRDQLETELAAAREEIERYRERWMRERADLENVKKRAERERTDAARYGTERLVGDLLSVLDDLERALHAADEGAGGAALLSGVQLAAKSFLDTLERHGVTRVGAHGQPFDPSHHEAVAHVASETHEPGMVIEEHRGGFRLKDRLLRPALVSVSKGSAGGGDLAKTEHRD